jgi:TonB family protein
MLRGSKGETLVSVNGTQLLELKKPGFYEMLLKIWIGARPPSSDFKARLLSMGAESQVMDLYVTLGPSPERIEEVAAWLEPEDDKDRRVAAAVIAVPTAAAIAAPSIAAAAPEAAQQSAEIERAVKEAADIEKAEIAKAEKAQQEVAAKIAALAQVEAVEAVEEDRELRETEQNKLLELYQHMVVRGILSNVKYPSKSVKRNQQGVAMLELTVNRRGEIVSVIFLEKTRYKRLNRAAEEAVAGVGKFPAVPEALDGEQVSVKLPVKFILS